jgi:hypothetical protein
MLNRYVPNCERPQCVAYVVLGSSGFRLTNEEICGSFYPGAAAAVAGAATASAVVTAARHEMRRRGSMCTFRT